MSLTWHLFSAILAYEKEFRALAQHSLLLPALSGTDSWKGQAGQQKEF